MLTSARTPLFAVVRLCIAGALAITFGFTWTVGQGGLGQVNSNLCELWRSLPLWRYDECEFQYALVWAWLGAGFAIGIWILFETYHLISQIKNRKRRLLAHAVLVMFFLVGSAVSIFLLVADARRSQGPTLSTDGAAKPTQPFKYSLVWDDHLGHSYSSEGTTILTQAIQIGAKNGDREIRLEDAYIVSGQGNGEVKLRVGSDQGWIEPNRASTISPNSPIVFRAEFTPMPAKEFFDKWKTFRITVKHDDGAIFTKDVDEKMVAALYSAFRPNPIVPQVTARSTMNEQSPSTKSGSNQTKESAEEKLVGRARFLYDRKSGAMTIINKQDIELVTVDRENTLIVAAFPRFIARFAFYSNGGPFDVKMIDTSEWQTNSPLIYSVLENEKNYVKLLFEPSSSIVAYGMGQTGTELAISFYRK